MENIKLKSGVTINISQISQPFDSTLKFTAIGVNEYNAFRASLSKQALIEIQLFTGDTLAGIYENYTNIQSIGIGENEDGTMNITVVLKQESNIELRLAAVENAVETLVLTGLGAM